MLTVGPAPAVRVGPPLSPLLHDRWATIGSVLKPTLVLPALGLLTATLLASCGGSSKVLPAIPDRLPVTSVSLTVAPVPGWTPSNETVSLVAFGGAGIHLVGQGALTGGQLTVPLPGEAALGAALYLVDSATTLGSGCTQTQPGSGTGYSVPSFRSASLLFTAKTTTASTGERLLQDADPSGPAFQLVYVDRDVQVRNTVTCTVNGRTDVSTLDLDLLKGWNLAARTDSGTGPYTHTVRAFPSTTGTASLTLIGAGPVQTPTP